MDPASPSFPALHLSLSIHLANNRDPCPILHPVTSEQISEISRPDFPTIPTPRPDSVLFQLAGGASHGVAPDTKLAKLCCFRIKKSVLSVFKLQMYFPIP